MVVNQCEETVIAITRPSEKPFMAAGCGGNQFYISVTKKYLKHGNHYFGNFLSPDEVAQHQYLLEMLNTSAYLGGAVKFNWYTTGTAKDFVRAVSVMPLIGDGLL